MSGKTVPLLSAHNSAMNKAQKNWLFKEYLEDVTDDNG